MNQVKWYQKLGSAKAGMLFSLFTFTCLGVELLAVHWWHNELLMWMACTVMFVTWLVLLVAWVRRVRES